MHGYMYNYTQKGGAKMKEKCLYLEQLSFHTHPALWTEEYDGWLLRFANGYTKRANSVNIVRDSTLKYEEKIKYCESRFREQNLPTVFKLTTMSERLDIMLEEQKYHIEDMTNVMSVDLRNKDYTEIEDKNISVVIEKTMTDQWYYNFAKFKQVSQEELQMIKQIKSKIKEMVFCTTVYLNQNAVACGLGVLEDGHIGLLDIVVQEEYRGNGLGKVLCESILKSGKEAGATVGYLQVVDSNERAKRLYKSLGFEYEYSYWYRVK